MSKTRRHHKKSKRSFLRKIRNTAKKTLPVIASGLTKVGSDVKNITLKSKPVVEKGLGVIYDSVMTGFDLGVKGINKGIRTIKSRSASKTRRHRRKH
jgi:hypothetical protein